MASVIELLLETLADLSDRELGNFKEVHCRKPDSVIPQRLIDMADLQDTVFLMVQTYSQQSVEKTMQSLKELKRTDLAQRLSDSSLEPKKKHLDEHLSALIHKVATMIAVKELLLEALEDLSEQDVKEFKWFLQFTLFQKAIPQIPLSKVESADRAHIVDMMVETCGKRCVEVFREVFRDMGRIDLVQMLSETSSEVKEKLSVDERWPALIQKVETMESLIELLLETLAGLSDSELEDFKLVHWRKHKSVMSLSLFMMSDLQDMVFLMVQTYGQKSMETIVEVLNEMKRTDLAQRLSDRSLDPQEKHSEDERWPALIHNAEMMESVIELLLETLAALNDQELEEFKQVLFEIHYHKYYSGFPWVLYTRIDLQDTVFLMVQTYGQQSVEMAMEVLKKMKRTDLAQRLSDCSSLPRKKLSVDDRRSALIHKVATLTAVKHLLMETLNHLFRDQLSIFERFLASVFPRKVSYISWKLSQSLKNEKVDLMVEEFGLQSVQMIREGFMYLNKTDLVQKLPESSSGSREKLSVDELQAALDELQAALLQREEAREADRQSLFETLKDLSQKELNKFILLLPFTCFQKGLPQIKILYKEATHKLLDEMVDELGQQSMEVIREVLTDMSRTDLVQRLSESSSGSKGQEAKGSSELEGCGNLKQDSTDWTKLEPELNGTDADEAPTYSLQSEAGHFECGVSGLRWVCKEKASFQYQFGSWEGHMQRMESRGYMPAGPLMDVTVTAGKLNEVHLPHWICTDDIPDILDQFAVLHVDDCGDVVEKVSEVTPSHVKLMEPIFSPRAVLMRVGIPVKISCNMLIYQTNTAFLTLHVYLVPRDPGLQQVLRQREVSHGYKAILKPDPEKSLKMLDRFTLTADGAEICPPDLKLRYPSGKPNFFEVYTENPDGNFQLKLTTKKEFEPVWSCTVRKAEYQSTGCVQENHFVDKHRVELIQRVSNVGPILDELLKEQVIQQESYDRIRTLPTSQEKIRELYNGPLKAGSASKDVFYQILQTHERRLVNDLC